MGSDSDWPVMKAAADILNEFGVSYEAKVVSAHRTPDDMVAFAKLLSIVQMPKGIPVATVAINNSANAGLLAIRMLSISNQEIKKKVEAYAISMAEASRAKTLN